MKLSVDRPLGSAMVIYSHLLLANVCRLGDVKDGVMRVSILHYNTGEWVS